jgi:hypothetical protein
MARDEQSLISGLYREGTIVEAATAATKQLSSSVKPAGVGIAVLIIVGDDVDVGRIVGVLVCLYSKHARSHIAGVVPQLEAIVIVSFITMFRGM